MATTMQLEFAQAMSDFKVMFPDMDRDVIEAVLRANQGGVDATIDQLLTMSTDNQNEKLRNELDKCGFHTPNRIVKMPLLDTTDTTKRNDSIVAGSGSVGSPHNRQHQQPQPQKKSSSFSLTSAISQNVKKPMGSALVNSPNSSISSPSHRQQISLVTSTGCTSDDRQIQPTAKMINKKWIPPLLGPLPPTFLRLNSTEMRYGAVGEEMPDEQFALMLQNEEFMNELRWNQEFMLALDREQKEKGTSTNVNDMVFKERLRYMGKKSRNKFQQLARVFTWQRNKKPNAVRHPDSLLLQEEHSDDDEPKRTTKKKL